MKVPRIRDIVEKFKDSCRLRGWRVSEKNDWIETESGYHNFLWARSIHPSSFKNITASGKCVVRDGLSYRVVEASYIAWLFCETPSETLIRILLENREFSDRVALFSLAPLLNEKRTSFKMNRTDSLVFQEFENFLTKELGVKLRPFSKMETGPDECKVANTP